MRCNLFPPSTVNPPSSLWNSERTNLKKWKIWEIWICDGNTHNNENLRKPGIFFEKKVDGRIEKWTILELSKSGLLREEFCIATEMSYLRGWCSEEWKEGSPVL